ncbi:hypothetical protein KCU76_g20026, partial [Aureobasidium melanogenum]
MSNTNYPNLNPQLQNAKASAINAKDAVVNSKSCRDFEQIRAPTHHIADANAAYQNLANGPAAEKARIESQKTSQEYSNLMDSKRVPDQPAATGQPLTHYHSFFYNLL